MLYSSAFSCSQRLWLNVALIGIFEMTGDDAGKDVLSLQLKFSISVALLVFLGTVSWEVPERFKKRSLFCSAANSMELSLGWEDDGRLLSDVSAERQGNLGTRQ